jgi:hypothetical protein
MRLGKATPAAVLLLSGAAAAQPPQDLRDCVADARDAAAVAACEVTAQAALKARIERWSAAIRKRLDARERLLFDRNAAAWKAFFDSEVALLDLGLGKRADGLASKLRPGAVTRLYEQREEQLREHLHNLSIPGP